MSTISATLISLFICAAAAALEGVLAGKQVKSFLEELKSPRFAAPVWLWAVIGVLYYAICFFVLFRLFGYAESSLLKNRLTCPFAVSDGD